MPANPQHLNREELNLISRVNFYTRRDMAIPVDLEAALAAKGLSLHCDSISPLKETSNG